VGHYFLPSMVGAYHPNFGDVVAGVEQNFEMVV
jgi:hypothetical protein